VWDGVDCPLPKERPQSADSRTKRKLRRYQKHCKIERTNAWLQNFRRIQVRYDRILTVFQGFLHFACLFIALKHLCNLV
jgi:transposase